MFDGWGAHYLMVLYGDRIFYCQNKIVNFLVFCVQNRCNKNTANPEPIVRRLADLMTLQAIVLFFFIEALAVYLTAVVGECLEKPFLTFSFAFTSNITMHATTKHKT